MNDKLKHLFVFVCTGLLLSFGIFFISFFFQQKEMETPPPSEEVQVIKLRYIPNNSRTVYARITQYGWTGNRMANGEWPHEGAVATSDRTIPFGSVVLIDDREYTVKDRTALWVHERFGFTIDIYSENPVGREFKEVVIYQ